VLSKDSSFQNSWFSSTGKVEGIPFPSRKYFLKIHIFLAEKHKNREKYKEANTGFPGVDILDPLKMACGSDTLRGSLIAHSSL